MADDLEVKKGVMTDEELAALKIIANFYKKVLERIDVQCPDYPYFKATGLDLYRLLGEELLARG